MSPGLGPMDLQLTLPLTFHCPQTLSVTSLSQRPTGIIPLLLGYVTLIHGEHHSTGLFTWRIPLQTSLGCKDLPRVAVLGSP